MNNPEILNPEENRDGGHMVDKSNWFKGKDGEYYETSDDLEEANKKYTEKNYPETVKKIV